MLERVLKDEKDPSEQSTLLEEVEKVYGDMQYYSYDLSILAPHCVIISLDP
jgi:hypothetical protein